MADVLGIKVDDLPEGWSPVEAVVIIKCLLPEGDESGAYALAIRSSDGLHPWDTAGMLRAATLTNDIDLNSGAD